MSNKQGTSNRRRTSSRQAVLTDLDHRLEAHGRRIRALRHVAPGGKPRTGYSAQIAALNHSFRRSNAEFGRLVSLPDGKDEWDRTRKKLDGALNTLGENLEELERIVEPCSPEPRDR